MLTDQEIKNVYAWVVGSTHEMAQIDIKFAREIMKKFVDDACSEFMCYVTSHDQCILSISENEIDDHERTWIAASRSMINKLGFNPDYVEELEAKLSNANEALKLWKHTFEASKDEVIQLRGKVFTLEAGQECTNRELYSFLLNRPIQEYRDWLNGIFNIRPYSKPSEAMKSHLPDILIAIQGVREKDLRDIQKLERDNKSLSAELQQQRFNNEHNLSIDQTVNDKIKFLEEENTKLKKFKAIKLHNSERIDRLNNRLDAFEETLKNRGTL